MIEGQSELYCSECGANNWKITDSPVDGEAILICACGMLAGIGARGDGCENVLIEKGFCIWEFEKNLLANSTYTNYEIAIDKFKKLLESGSGKVKDWEAVLEHTRPLTLEEQKDFKKETWDLLCTSSTYKLPKVG